MEIPYPALVDTAPANAPPAAGLTSEDLAPTSAAARTWTTWNYAAL
ncbi:hypothetical protein GCM10027422_03260 [Hymenobacter arcticus]